MSKYITSKLSPELMEELIFGDIDTNTMLPACYLKGIILKRGTMQITLKLTMDIHEHQRRKGPYREWPCVAFGINYDALYNDAGAVVNEVYEAVEQKMRDEEMKRLN